MTRSTKRPKALLIDFYGTLVEDDEKPILEVCRKIAEASTEGVAWEQLAFEWFEIFSDLCSSSHGDKFILEREVETRTVQILLDEYSSELDSRRLVDGLYRHWVTQPIFPETKEVLAKCDLPVCLVTNVDNDPLNAALKFAGLSFDLTVTSEDCRSYKPRPETFAKALELLGMKSGDVLHVGDSLVIDVRGAKDLDIPAMWISRQGGEPSADVVQPDYVSKDLYGILDVLNSKKTRTR